MSLDLENPADENDDGKPASGGGGAGKRGRPTKDAQASGRQTRVKEQLEELAEWVGGRDPELGEIIRSDAQRIAKVLAARSGKHARLAWLVDVVFAPDGPLAALRAFGRTARAVLHRVGAYRQQRAAEYVDEAGYLVAEDGQRILDEAGQPIFRGQPAA